MHDTWAQHTNLTDPKSQQLNCRIHSSHKNCQPRQLTNSSKTRLSLSVASSAGAWCQWCDQRGRWHSELPGAPKRATHLTLQLCSPCCSSRSALRIIHLEQSKMLAPAVLLRAHFSPPLLFHPLPLLDHTGDVEELSASATKLSLPFLHRKLGPNSSIKSRQRRTRCVVNWVIS